MMLILDLNYEWNSQTELVLHDSFPGRFLFDLLLCLFVCTQSIWLLTYYIVIQK